MLNFFVPRAKNILNLLYSVLSIYSQRHLSLPPPPYERNINIMLDPAFKAVNTVMAGKFRKMKKEGLDVSKQYEPIPESDIRKLYSSGALSSVNLTSLQHKVYFELSIHFARRGHEDPRELSKVYLL